MKNLEKQLSCCFTGHRPDKLNITEKDAKALLCVEIEKAINRGFTVFITGMAQGVDIWAGEIVLEYKNIYHGIRLICALPYPTFYNNRNRTEKLRYQKVLSAADVTHISSPVCNPWCYQSRNMWMVDQSDLVIALYNGEPGGTRNTINYAKEQDIEIINLLN